LPNDLLIQFLTVEDVKRLHKLSIARYGGSFGIRDQGLLSSAIQMPAQTFGGEYLHPSLASMAAAYLFHVCQNHAFLDGNKRAGLLACEAFLRLNGHELTLTSAEAEATTLQVAEGKLNKEDLAALLEQSIALIVGK
jgi:death-on-curing protein